MKKLILPIVLSLLPLTSMAVGIQSNGTASAAWSANSTSTPLPLTLTNHEGIFLNYTFSLGATLDATTTYGSVYITLDDDENEFVYMSFAYLGLGDEINELTEFADKTSDFFSIFITENGTSANVNLGSTNNYLGIQVWEQTAEVVVDGNGTESVIFTNTNPHYGWIQLQLNSTGTGVTFITGYVNNTANETATVGTVPEPSTVALLVAAVTGMALLGRSEVRQKK